MDGSKLGESALHYNEGMISDFSAGEHVEGILIQIIAPTFHRINENGEALQGAHLSREEIEPIKEKAMACLEQLRCRVDKDRHSML